MHTTNTPFVIAIIIDISKIRRPPSSFIKYTINKFYKYFPF